MPWSKASLEYIIMRVQHIFLIFFLLATSCKSSTWSDSTDMVSYADSVSYAIGMDLAQYYYQNHEIEINPNLLYEGFRDMMNEEGIQLNQSRMEELTRLLEEQIKQKHQSEIQKVAEVNSKLEKAFLLKNKSRQDISSLESGLQYKVLDNGQGDSPDLSSIVKLDFEGKLLDGTTFLEKGTRNVAIADALPGLQQALTRMKPGSHWEIFIPAHLGWGMQEKAGVEPNSMLIFDMKMIEIVQ